jgi:hypothetical protein
MSMISDAIDSLNDDIDAYLSESITYASGINSVAINAIIEPPDVPDYSVLGQTPNQIDGTQRDPLNYEWNFNILATDLVLAGAIATPKEGDLITATFRGVAQIFEVAPSVNGGKIWEPADLATRMIVHTRRYKDA